MDGYSGGGATDVRAAGAGLSERRLVAGGGGAMGGFSIPRRSGAGGGLIGLDGQGSFAGNGGTQNAGGASSTPGGEGGLGQGGPTNNYGHYYYGGGGGGWYGGGAGSGGGGAGGGSGFGPEGTVFETGVRRGHGSASITVPERTLTVETRTTYPGPTDGLGYVQAAGGIDCGYGGRTNCTADYLQGTPVTLTATPADGASFAYWTGACTGTSPVCVASVSSAVTAVAVFEITRHPLTVVKPGTGSGTVRSTPIMGFTTIVCGATCGSGFLGNATVTLTATPDPGTDFVGWSGDCSGPSTTCTVDMATATGTVNATFTLQKRSLSVSRTGTGAGTVSSDVAGLACGSACVVDLDYGTEVTLQATPATGSEFLGWGPGPCSAVGTTPTCVVTMDQARNQVAEFGLRQFALSVTRAGSGIGTVTSDRPGIDCGLSCTSAYDYDTEVTLTAAAGTNSHFSGWSGACTGASSSCTVSVRAARTVTATFDLDRRALTAATDGSGAGTVTSDVGGIDCGSACTASVEHGTTVTLTATPASSSSFTGWTGACTGTGPCVVTMSQARSGAATFTLKAYDLDVGLLGTGAGRVTSSPVGIDCGASCTTTADHGTTITLTAVADADSDFSGWTGACAGTASTCAVTMDQARAVGASFTRTVVPPDPDPEPPLPEPEPPLPDPEPPVSDPVPPQPGPVLPLPGPVIPPPVPDAGAGDQRAPRFTLRVVRTRAGVVRRSGRLVVRLTSNERARYRIQPVGSRSVQVATTTAPRVIRIKLTGALRKRVRGARAATVRVKVRVVGTDPSGNTVRRTITLRIRR